MVGSGTLAARRVFDIADLKERILSLVPKQDLLQCMKVNKRWFEDSVRDVYKVVNYERVVTIMEGESTRIDLYLSSIVEINARMLRVSLMAKHFKALEEKNDEIPDVEDTKFASQYLNNYHLEIYELIVPPLLSSCPNLLRILFGGPYRHFGRQSWTVHFGPAPYSPETPYIEHTSHLKISPQAAPPNGSKRPLIPPTGATISRRYDLSIVSEVKAPSASMAPEWKKAIKEGEPFGRLYKAIKLGSIPLTMDDLIHLYQRQIDAGFKERFEHVSALNVSSWDITDFGNLARISGGALTTLLLTKDWPRDEEAVNLSFDDLPTLISIVQTHLPKLEILHINMKGIETAEEKCKELLHPDILEISGNLKDFMICTASDETFIFNILRVCSQLVSAEGEIAVNYYGREFWGGDNQTELVRCLKKQPRERRKVLSTFDFAAMGVEDVDAVLDLNYDENHQPSIGDEGQHYFQERKDTEEGRIAAWEDWAKRMQKSFAL